MKRMMQQSDRDNKGNAKNANAANDRIAEISKIVDSLEGTIFDKIRSSMVVKK